MLVACAASDRSAEQAGPDVAQLAIDVHRDHGWAAIRAERYEEAASYFQRILKDRPDDHQAHLGLGEAYLGQGRLAEALSQFTKLDSQARAAERARALQGQGIVFLRQGEQQEALASLERAIRQDGGLWRSWNALGRLHDAEKDYAKARKAYRKAIALSPKAAFLHN
ncbi:MAG: tetratricopeptide repeat protein, partial [Geminicoccaceae bacterium]